MTLKLKLDGDKLSGTILGRDGKENPIQDPAYKDGDVSFKVVRERNGNKVTASYSGKVSGDTIKGKIQVERGQGPEPGLGSQTGQGLVPCHSSSKRCHCRTSQQWHPSIKRPLGPVPGSIRKNASCRR